MDLKEINSSVLDKNINNKYKLIPLYLRKNKIGPKKYLPASSIEWKNNIYTFNKINTKNLPVYDININNLMKNYFNLYFNYKFIKSKLISHRLKNISLNRIFVSKPNIKHTNSKAIITIYTFNKERLSLLRRIRMLEKTFYKKIFLFFYKNKNFFSKYILKFINNENLKFRFYNKFIELLLIKELILIRRYKLKLNLNNNKFEEKFLYRFSYLISKFYKKKVEINVINLKTIMLNSNIFTEILGLKVKKKNTKPLKIINILINKAKLTKINRIYENTNIIKNINSNLIENKYESLNLNTNLKEVSLDNQLSNIYYDININNDSFFKLYNLIFNYIRYKNIRGIRLEVKGRLTWRYRADRALFKVKWKGGLKNTDSSYKGLSSVNLRGYLNSNVEYSIFTSKRRIGAFAAKGWLSGK